VILISAWWGQYESIYTAAALVAIVLAAEGRVVVGAAAVAVAVMTKPQALPFLLPYGAWTGGRFGIRRLAVAIGAGVLVVVVLWLPFVATGGPLRWLGSVRSLQDGPFAIVAINTWNLWGLVQGFITTGSGVIPDNGVVAGLMPARTLGLGMTGLLSVVLAVGMARRPSHAALVVGMTAGALVAFAFLTTMHERYLYPAVVLPLALVWWRPARLLWLALSTAFFAELIWSLQTTDPFVGLGSGLDVFRVPVAVFIVIVALGAVVAVVVGRLPADAEWNQAVGCEARPEPTLTAEPAVTAE
jgi:dolichyl-phosphate-mannose-protein mannosyltransferase